MKFRDFHILKNSWQAIKDFFKEGGMDKCSILAYYSIFSSLFLLTFFTFLFTRFLGDPNLALKSIFPFSPEFFTSISPEIFKKAAEISNKLRDVGLLGILFSFILGFLVIMKIVHFVNAMFHIDLKNKRTEKGFWVRRLSEFSLLFLVGFMVIASFFLTGLLTTIAALIRKNEFLAGYINPQFLAALNTFLVKYIVPFFVTFLFFFVLYKWIPEKIVYVKGAVVAAFISTILWEGAKRAYAYYLVNISIFGQIKGPIIALILFGFWMELSMGIMLFGAKLTYIFDKENSRRTEIDGLAKRLKESGSPKTAKKTPKKVMEYETVNA